VRNWTTSWICKVRAAGPLKRKAKEKEKERNIVITNTIDKEDKGETNGDKTDNNFLFLMVTFA
jgi:hypothetical protein